MRRVWIVLIGILSLVAAFYAFLHVGLSVNYQQNTSIWIGLILPIILITAAIGLIIYGCSGNVYGIKEGTVVEHKFVKAHMVQAVYSPGVPGTGNMPGIPSSYVPAYWVQDEWSIRIQDPNGRTTWLSFSSNVFDQYPVGSYYKPN